MKVLAVETFFGYKPYNALVNFVNENNIQKEDILKVTHFDDGKFVLFYYTDRA